MTKEIDLDLDIKISVFLKNGDSFSHRDITNLPTGEYKKVISFWDIENILCIYPIDQVDHYEYTFTEKQGG